LAKYLGEGTSHGASDSVRCPYFLGCRMGVGGEESLKLRP
jgi:hypothetical protein